MPDLGPPGGLGGPGSFSGIRALPPTLPNPSKP